MADRFQQMIPTTEGISAISDSIANDTNFAIKYWYTFTDNKNSNFDFAQIGSSYKQAGLVGVVKKVGSTAIVPVVVSNQWQDINNHTQELSADYNLSSIAIVAQKSNGVLFVLGVFNAVNVLTISKFVLSAQSVLINASIQLSGIDAVDITVKSGGLLSTDDYDSLQEYADDIGNKKQDLSNVLDYKMISATVTDAVDLPTSTFTHIAYAGATTALVSGVLIQNNTDPNLVAMSQTKLLDAINRAKNAGCPVSMLKPHIITQADGDGFSRPTYAPSDYSTFFTNWKTILLALAKICNDNQIPILSIGCEQTQNTDQSHLSSWQDIINTIHNSYPNVKLTYSMSVTEYSNEQLRKNHGQIFRYLDFVGMNVYPEWTSEKYSVDMDYKEISKGWYADQAGADFEDWINWFYDAYNKQTIITENGIMPQADSLNQVMSNHNNATPDFNVTKLAMQAMFFVIRHSSHIKGYAWWHTNWPFEYYNSDSNVSVSEAEIKQYFEEDII